MKEIIISPMTARIMEETRGLPPIMDQRLNKEIWHESWEKYLQEMKELPADEDPYRPPPVEFWHRKTTI